NGHRIVSSSPLLPANDPTLLFANAGMNQFKDVFLGAEKRDYKRATTSQKCVRAGGKHNDLDEVGKTARHHTFFEMLGNFSFGDYFKEDAIKFAWELLVDELKLDPTRLWFSVFEGDGEVGADVEAEELWVKVGAPRERVLRFGRKDNFWQMGETGPCGPCSEIHYYRGENPNDPNFNKAEYVNGTGDDTMEIWNLVFMQYNRSEIEPGKYKLDPLPAPSVDTGMGLERVTAVLQGVYSNYDTDLIKPIIDFTAQLCGKDYSYESQEGFAMRVIADHARATAFSIADGILPGNEGRNYVLRKIMRRAIYNGRENLGFRDEFFFKVCEFVVDFMKEAYPELDAQRGYIEKMVRLEEQRFGTTLTVGLKKLDELLEKCQSQRVHNQQIIKEDVHLSISAIELAHLLDTYGTPIDLMFVRLQGINDVVVLHCKDAAKNVREHDEESFREVIQNALREIQMQGGSAKAEGTKAAKPVYVALQRRHDTKTEFKGYETTRVEGAKVIALIKGDDSVNSLNAGDEGEVVLDQTPFYAESGGQVGDVGSLSSDSVQATVNDTATPVQDVRVHKVKIEKGSLNVGDLITASVDVEKRDATRRNHTATHLMHAALREVLGTHVKQAGSIVAPDYLRFDFAHYQPLTASE
ncbi:MAG: alanine--tRNA ligase, partial [Blastocatellia bacterium]|nr:alanine--tRNA ligase [Blastocatellia bacterium]